MNATQAIDLEDADGLIAADRAGLLRAASNAGAQVRAVAAACNEGELDSLRVDDRPRSVIWVAGRGTAETAGIMLASTLGAAAAEPIVLAAEAPPWIGPLDVLIIAGDDPGDPALVSAAATGVRRGARVVVVAPYEGPLRDTTAGRVAVLEPRVWVPDEFRLSRYLAAGLAVFHTVYPKLRIELAVLADELDAETLRNSAARDLFTNPAKTLAARVSQHRVALAGDNAATVALARHGSSILLRIAHEVVAASGLADAVVALREGIGSRRVCRGPVFGGCAVPRRGDRRTAARSAAGAGADAVRRTNGAGRPRRGPGRRLPGRGRGCAGAARYAGRPDLVDRPLSAPGGARGAEQQLAVLAVRLEMAAVYLRLVRG